MALRLDRPLLARTAALVIGGAAVGLGVNAARPGGVALVAFEPPTACSAASGHEGPVLELDARAASTLCGHEGVVFADTRPAARFAEGHVADALHLPCNASARGAEGALKKLAGARTIVVYGDSSDDGHEVAETLRRKGIGADLRVLVGGFAAWEGEGLACASGPCRDCTAAESRP